MLILFAVLIVVTMVIWFSLQFTGKNRKITGLDIRISPDSGVYFLSQQDISNMVTQTTGNPIGKSLSEVGIAGVESRLRKMPHVLNAQAFVSMDGKLRIKVQQRVPVLRVQNSHNESFYIDSSGIKMPARGYRAPDILVANGNITEKLGDSSAIHSGALIHLLRVARFIASDPYWDLQFEQCYVDNSGDIILVSRTSTHSIVIGTADNLNEKMANLRIFYEKALRNIGWDRYSVINLKYRGQIVGVRNGKETEHTDIQTVQNPQH